eukprot:m.8451 g.8451  ORF g.8451 m.8451 type:complete len:385 (+) comp20603_c0_seq2:1398-2552(+)
MGEKPVFSSRAIVFTIDPETKKSWLQSSQSSVPVAFYHDSSRKTYRIISVDSGKALINSTILPTMSFTKTGAKFGQWRDAATNTIYGLGFTTETDLDKFAGYFSEVKTNMNASASKPKASSASVGSEPKAVEAIEGAATLPNGTGDVRKNNLSLANDKSGKDEKGSATPQRKLSISEPSGSLETQLQELRHENDRLKHALAASSCHRDKWEAERQKLTNNNTLLRTGLQESKMNVEEWKSKMKQQQEENQKLKQRVQELEASEESRVSESTGHLQKEKEELEKRVREMEVTLREKDKELSTLTLHATEFASFKTQNEHLKHQFEKLEMDNADLSDKVSDMEDKLQVTQTTADLRIERIAGKSKTLSEKLQEMLQIQKEIDSEFQ